MAERRGDITWLALALAMVGLVAIGLWSFATDWAPSTELYPLQGLDLGENPPAAEWPTVRAAGADFVYLVATAGADRRDPAFEANWEALPDAGLRRGGVHLYSLCQPATDQTNAFNLVCPRRPTRFRRRSTCRCTTIAPPAPTAPRWWPR